MEPAVLVDGLGGLLGHVVVALHDVVAAAAEFARGVWGDDGAGFGVDDLDFDEGLSLSDGFGASLEGGFVGVGHGEDGRGLGESVGDGDFAHAHLLDAGLDDIDGADGAGDDAGAEAGEVEHAEHGVVQLGDVHGGHAVDGGRLRVLDGGQHDERVEVLDHDGGGAVAEDGHDAQHTAEAVEQRHRQAHAVRVRELLALADVVAVVEDVAVGEHDALGEASRAGRVLHIDDVAVADALLGLVEDLVVDAGAELEQLHARVHAALLLLPQVAGQLDALVLAS